MSRQFDVWTTLQSVRILELNFPDFCSNNKLSCKTRSTVWRTSILAIFQYCLEEKKKLQFASQHCARAHTLGQDSIFCPIIEFRSKCEFLPFFQLLRNFGVEIRILCAKIHYFLKASFLVRKFKLVIGSPIFEPKKDFCPSVCAWLCPFFLQD